MYTKQLRSELIASSSPLPDPPFAGKLISQFSKPRSEERGRDGCLYESLEPPPFFLFSLCEEQPRSLSFPCFDVTHVSFLFFIHTD